MAIVGWGPTAYIGVIYVTTEAHYDIHLTSWLNRGFGRNIGIAAPGL